jgi:peroxiredoxin
MNTPEPTKSRMSPVLLLFLAMPIAGLIMAALVIISNPPQLGTATSNIPGGSLVRPASTSRPPGILNNPAPDFTLSTIDGERVSLSDYAGKVVFINFWGTWCPPCVEELPALQDFAAQHAESAVVLAINSSETPDVITQFLDDNAMILSDIPLLLDEDYRVFQEYGVYNMPTTYVVSPDGILVNFKLGGFTTETLQAYFDEAKS